MAKPMVTLDEMTTFGTECMVMYPNLFALFKQEMTKSILLHNEYEE